MTEYYEEFETVDAGASLTYPVAAGDLKQGGMMTINGRPCKIVSISFAKTGKHGHAKASITAIDIFNLRKLEDSLPGSANVDVPNVSRRELQAIAIDGEGFVTLMSEKGDIRSDLKLPEETEKDAEVAKRIQSAVDDGRDCFVTILAAMGIEKISEVTKDN